MLVKIRLILIVAAIVLFAYDAKAQKVIGDDILTGGGSKLSVNLVSGNFYLGWLNPDGARQLSNEFEMIFEVCGAKKQKFSAIGSFDWKDRTVFITNNRWYYDGYNNNSWQMIPGDGNYFAKNDCKIKDSNIAKAYFKLVPGTVFASPNAKEGFYTFEVTLEVQDTSL